MEPAANNAASKYYTGAYTGRWLVISMRMDSQTQNTGEKEHQMTSTYWGCGQHFREILKEKQA